jgi:peroxiredoxin
MISWPDGHSRGQAWDEIVQHYWDQSQRLESGEEERTDMPRGIHERRLMATILLSILVLLTPMAAKALTVGEKAPDFLAFSTVGESVRLSDYQGKQNVLIFFFVRAFGGVWTNEGLAFQLDLPKFESLDTQVLGVSVDHIGAQQAFAEKLGLTYPLVDDFSRDIVQKYGVMDDDPNSPFFRYAKRAYVIIDKQGIVRYRHIMDQPGHLLDSEEILGQVAKVVKGK